MEESDPRAASQPPPPSEDPPLPEARAALLDGVLAATPLHIYRYDAEGRYLYASPAGARALGLTPAQMTGRTWRELDLPAHIMERFEAQRERVMADGEPLYDEVVFPTVDGPRTYEYYITPVRGPGGAIEGAVATSCDVSARRATEDVLRESEERFRAALVNAPIGMALVGLDGRFLHVNPALCEIVGYSEEELVALTFQEITHPDDLEADLAQARELEAGRIPSYQIEKRYLHKDGHPVWIQLTGSRVADPNGATLYFVAQVQDITGRRRDEDAQRRLTNIIEATSDLVLTTDPEGRLRFVNRAGRTLLARADLTGHTLWALLPAAAASHLLREAVPQAIREGVWRGESAVLADGGREVPVSMVLVAHRAADGTLEYLSAVMRDISDARREAVSNQYLADASRALSGSLELDQILGVVTDLVVPCLADYCLIDLLEGATARRAAVAHVTPEGQALVEALQAWPPVVGHGVGAAAVLSSGQSELVAEVTDAWLHAVSRGPAHRAALGALRPCSEMIVALQARGRVVGTITCGTVHPDHRLGTLDLALAEKLAVRVGLAIDNAGLYAETRRAVTIRDEVLRVVAHDLRSPIASIALTAGALRRSLPPDVLRASENQLRVIERSTERAHRLIDDLLDLARMVAGQLRVEPAPTDPAALLHEVVALHDSQAREKRLTLVAEVAPGLPRVLADRDRAVQVLANLVGNALKFTPAGGRVTLRAAPADDAVRFDVEDTGPGITPEDQARIFDPFWQAGGGSRHGAGLGLAIARGLVESHGGHISLGSVRGKGTTLTFTLPIAPNPS